MSDTPNNQGPEPIPFPPHLPEPVSPPHEEPEPNQSAGSTVPPLPPTPTPAQAENVTPGRLYLDCVDPETQQPVRLALPVKFPALTRDLQATLAKRPAMKDQSATLLTYSAMKGADGKQSLVEQRIFSGTFEKIIEWVVARTLSKEDAMRHLMKTLAQIANCSTLRLATITVLDENENGPVPGGFTMMFVPEGELTTKELALHYHAAVGHAEEFREKVEKTRSVSLGGEKDKARILKPGDAGFVMPRRKRP